MTRRGSGRGEPRPIGNLTDNPGRRYAAELDAAESLEELRATLARWPILAPDARRAARKLTAADWPEWRRGLQSERHGRFAGAAWAERYSDILIPRRMLNATMVAEQFQVPWGLAWLRLAELGKLDDLPG